MKTEQKRFRTKRTKKTKRKNRTKQKKTRKMTQRRKRTQRGGTTPNTSINMMDEIFRGTIFEPYDKFIILKKYYENKGLVFPYTNLNEVLYNRDHGDGLIRRFLRDVSGDDLVKIYQSPLDLQAILTKRDEAISKYNEIYDKVGQERHIFLEESPLLPKIDGGMG